MTNKSAILFVVFLFTIFSCTERSGNTSVIAEEAGTDSLNAISDTVKTGVPIPVTQMLITEMEPATEIKAGQPDYSLANINIISIQSPGIKLVSENPETRMPGRDSILFASEHQPEGKKTHVRFPAKVDGLSPATMDAAYYSLQYLDVDQGLSSSYVMDIVEDSRGNLWVSTWATGVSMYNGRSFTNFDNSSGLNSNYVWSIFEDSKGNIWFGYDGAGVSMYDGHHFTSFNAEDGLSGDLVNKIIEDERNNMWFATNNGLTKYDGENFYVYQTQNGLKSNMIRDISMGSNNRLLIATDNGFSIFDGVVFTHYTQADGLPTNDLSVIFEDSEENIWLGTGEKGVTMFDGYTFFSFDQRHGLSGNSINHIMEDSYGHIWIGTANNGISIYNRTSFTQITKSQGLSSNSIRSIYEDSDLNIWLGTHGGLNKYNERSFQNFTDEQGLGGLIVRGICEDKYGNLWFGHSNGASKYDGQKYEHYTINEGLGDNVIRAIIQDQNGNLWFGTNGGGATFYDGENFIQYRAENGLLSDIVLAMYEDSNGDMWFGTYGAGAVRFDGTHFYQLGYEQGLNNPIVRSICEDANGNMWFGTNGGGLEKYDGKYITHYTTKEGLANNSVLSLMPDTQGNLWVGTEGGGLNVMSNQQIMTIDTRNGLSNNIIWSIVEDYENNIWVGTEKGLNVIEVNGPNEIDITTFGKLDGLKGIDFYPNAVCLDSDNKLWWGTGRALAMLDLEKYERQVSAPTVSFTDIRIDQSFVDFRELMESNKSGELYEHEELPARQLEKIKYDSILRFSNFPSNLEIPYDLNHLTFHFSANDWTAPHKIKYQYKLEGAGNEWHTLTDDNKVVYSYLPEGDYVFHLRAIGEAKIWSETLKFNITVSPPWWRTIWAYMSYFALAILIIILITTVRTKNLIHQRKLLEKLVYDRTQEVVKQKELVESKNKEIIDSITYAKRIQRAILPSHSMIRKRLENVLIFFKPKDIVAGDFYWIDEKNDRILLAVADCTGHGVPGAMVSLVCNNTLSRTIREFNLTEPDIILNKVRDIVIESFTNTNSQEEVKDGMDIALISWDVKTNKVEFAGANNNLYIFSEGKLTVLRADRQPIGKYIISKDFSKKEIQLKPGDRLYMFSDGYADQFGGERGKKLKSIRFVEMLTEIQHMPMDEQKRFLERTFTEWKGNLDQVDDVCVLGFEIP